MRCKVTCSYKHPQEGGGIHLGFSPVVSGSKENEEFFRWTPGANIFIYTVNNEVAANFELGKEYYLDFTPANA